MKRTILLSVCISLCILTLQAQKRSKDPKPITAYAITSVQKGQNAWTEVRLVDIATGEELKTVYQSAQTIEALNARTGKAVVKNETNFKTTVPVKRVVNLDQELNKDVLRTVTVSVRMQTDKPFSTNSAACAYDKKHERLYYTPLGINQLRYIDLKNPANIYYFENEAFGAITSVRDVPNQITRMAFASDGNGYALTNNADHLIRFGTDKKAEITDLGALSDDAANGNFSVHNPAGFGGDMVADANGGLYLITANRNVFKIDINSKVAAYKGKIQNLPAGYTTNGAAVEGGSVVIVNSANSTMGYYKFDMNTLQAEKVSNAESVYNSSDLANGNLLFEKKKKDKQQPEVAVKPEQPKADALTSKSTAATQVDPQTQDVKISLYPNPVTNGFFKLSFEDQPAGKYQVQIIDISGKLIKEQQVVIENKVQVEEFRLPQLTLGGNYLVKIVNETNKVVSVNKMVVQ